VKKDEFLRIVMLASSSALVLEIVLWEIWIAPLKPGGSMLVLAALPALFLVRSAWKRSNYGLQISSMLILIYLAEGAVRIYSDRGRAVPLAALEMCLVVAYFSADLIYLAPLKRAAKSAKKT
jgi:uncharacterized membrane protein